MQEQLELMYFARTMPLILLRHLFNVLHYETTRRQWSGGTTNTVNPGLVGKGHETTSCGTVDALRRHGLPLGAVCAGSWQQQP